MNAHIARAVAAAASAVITLALFNGIAWLADPVVTGHAATASTLVAAASNVARPH